MITKHILRAILVCTSISSTMSVVAQNEVALSHTHSRLLRYTPPYPYDTNGEYQLMRAMLRTTDVSGKRIRESVDLMQKYSPWSYLLVGKNFQRGKWEIGIDGLAFILPHYNKYDGLWLGYEVQASFLPKEEHKISLRSSQNYALKSHQWYSENHLIWHYAPAMNALAILSGGHTTRSIIHLTPEDLYRGYFPQLVNDNQSPEYRAYFASMRHRINPLPWFGLSFVGAWANRYPHKGLENSLDKHKSLTLDAIASIVIVGMSSYDYFPPKHRETTPIDAQGYNPLELSIRYKEALGIGTEYSQYNLAELSLSGAWAFNEDYKIDYRVTAGKFLHKQRVYLPDRRSVPQDNGIGRLPLSYQWTTLPHNWSAGESWLMTELNLQAYGMLLPQNSQVTLGLDEAIHLKGYKGKGTSAYWEAGYSIGWGNLFRLGGFIGYDFEHRNTRLAMRLSLPISMLLSQWSERL